MNANIRKSTIRNAYHIIKLDKDIWDDIAEFVEGYDNVNIMICAANTTENYDTMKTAYDAICKYTDDIHIIKISADKLDEQIELKYTNDDLPITYLQEFKYTCHSDRERELRRYFDKLRDDSRTNKHGANSVYRFIAASLVFANQILYRFHIVSTVIYVVFLFTAILVIYLALDVSFMNRLLGKKHIQFWVNKDKIDEYEKKNSKINKVLSILNSLSVILFLLAGIMLIISIYLRLFF